MSEVEVLQKRIEKLEARIEALTNQLIQANLVAEMSYHKGARDELIKQKGKFLKLMDTLGIKLDGNS